MAIIDGAAGDDVLTGTGDSDLMTGFDGDDDFAAEARRVLKQGDVFAVYDVMRASEGELSFPVHWAAGPETSFVAAPAEYRQGARGRRVRGLQGARPARVRRGLLSAGRGARRRGGRPAAAWRPPPDRSGCAAEARERRAQSRPGPGRAGRDDLPSAVRIA
jgi:hypothetical protein